MHKYSIRSLAAAMIAALLLAILALPVAGVGASGAGGTSTGATLSASKSSPFATYTRKRRVVRRKRRVVRRKRRIVRRKRRVVRKVVATVVAPLAVAAPAPVTPAPATTDETALAQALLDGLKAQYPRYLGGATVVIGDAMGYQAVSYYTTGRIVISPTHTATLSRIMNHEIWHIIDWQDNSTIDWGEAIPPANMSTYAN